MFAAWNHLDREDVFDAFIDTVLPYVKSHRQGLIGKRGGELDATSAEFRSKRRKVLVALLSSLKDEESWFHLSLSSTFSFNAFDVDWVIEEWQSASDETLKNRLLDLIKGWIGATQSFYSEGARAEFVSKVYDPMQHDPALSDELGVFFDAIELDSANAETLKTQFTGWIETSQKWRRDIEEPKDLAPSPLERMLECLERFEKGEADGFWMLNREMTLRTQSTHYGDELQSDLRRLPGWIEADESLRERIVAAARTYLFTGDPSTSEWIGTNIIQFSAFSGYRAIKLLQNLDTVFIDSLPVSVWEKWTPIVYFYPIYNGSNQDEYHHHQDLVAKAYRITPNSFPELIAKEIARETTQENAHISFDKFDKCWDANLKELWRARLSDDDLSVSLRERIFSQLLDLNDGATKELAMNLVQKPVPSHGDARNLVAAVCGLLIRHGHAEAWPRIQEVLNDNPDFGKDMLSNGVSRFGGAVLEKLNEVQLRDLYLWLAKEYPHSEDPDFSNQTMAHFVGPREELGRWRNLVLDKLKDRGTKEAVAALEEIAKSRPDLDWLKFTIVGAKNRAREKGWIPHPLSELRQLLNIDNSIVPTIKVLFFASNPSNVSQLALDEEARSIQNEISSNKSFRFVSRWATRPGDVLKALNEERPQIVHFSGHGNSSEIALQDDSGGYVLVPKEAINKALSTAPNALRVVIFNTCNSSTQAEELTQFIDVSIGMGDTIDDNAARVFAAQFYSAIGFGNSIKIAFEQARASLMIHGIAQDHVPMLYTRKGLKPESIILID